MNTPGRARHMQDMFAFRSEMAMSAFWWIRQIILVLVSCFFLIFGIQLLISAYGLNNPFWFIMTFFSSNLIILISAALLIGFIYRMVASREHRSDDEPYDGRKN